MIFTITDQWRDALAELVVVHPDRRSTPVLQIDGSHLHVSVARAHDTVDPKKIHDSLAIASVELTFFPGADLARQWFTAAWVGYLQHEALELVTWRGRRPLDPHEEPYRENPYNRSLRDGFPAKLTPATMRVSLLVVMDEKAVDELIKERVCRSLTKFATPTEIKSPDPT